jgi:hypothetical protein
VRSDEVIPVNLGGAALDVITVDILHVVVQLCQEVVTIYMEGEMSVLQLLQDV